MVNSSGSSALLQALMQSQQNSQGSSQSANPQQEAMIASLFSQQPSGNSGTRASAASDALSKIIGAYVMKNEPNWQAQSDANSVNSFAQPGGEFSQMQRQGDQQLSQDTNAQIASDQSGIDSSMAAQALQKLPVQSINPSTATMGTIGE